LEGGKYQQKQQEYAEGFICWCWFDAGFRVDCCVGHYIHQPIGVMVMRYYLDVGSTGYIGIQCRDIFLIMLNSFLNVNLTWNDKMSEPHLDCVTAYFHYKSHPIQPPSPTPSTLDLQ
jgi:hypothetical protein